MMMIDRPSQVLLASASRSAITTSDAQNYAGLKGGFFFLDVTVTPGAGADIEVQLEAKDPVSDQYVQFTDFTPVEPLVLGGHATFLFVVYPNEAGTYTTGNTQHISSPLPAWWRARVTPSGAMTFSLAVQYLP